MLRIIVNTSAASAKTYYNQGLAREDYYSQDKEIKGKWGGITSKLLQLPDEVEKQHFERLADNIHPIKDEKLTPRTNSNRRVGYDINFHAPKSLSILHSQTKDERIVKAFQKAVNHTMRQLEKEAQTRVRKKGENKNRTTGNLVWAEYTHFTARPVNNIPDPHLHIHAFTFNATYDAKEKKIKAVDIGNIKKNAPYYQAIFHNKLANNIQEIGYQIERNKKAWEVKGISKSLVNKFSQRTRQIEEQAKKLGVTGEKEKDKLGAKTRASKRTGLTQKEILQNWQNRLSNDDKIELINTTKQSPARSISEEHALSYAIENSFERNSVISENKLLTNALQYGVGSLDENSLTKEFKKFGIIKKSINGENYVTTRKILEEEKEMLNFAKQGRGKRKSLGNINFKPSVDFLNDNQKNAIDHILKSKDEVTIITGEAGVGKTTLMKEAVNGIKENKKNVFAFAPSAEASIGVLRKEGFINANTVSQLLVNKKLQEKTKDNVIWVDEAGLLGTRTMAKLFDVAKEQNARIILTGDTKQHKSVERGDAMRLLTDRAGITTPRVTQIQRQKGNYKQAVKNISQGNIKDGFLQLDKMGAIFEQKDKERYSIMANDYISATKGKNTAIIVAPTHNEGKEVTEHIRTKLKQSKKLGTKERNFTIQKDLGLTQAQKKNPLFYEEGMMVQFHQKTKGNFKRGQKVKIVDVKNSYITVETKNNIKAQLPLSEAQNFNIYATQDIALSIGDKIRITKNGFTDTKNRLNNGSIYQVKNFDKNGNIKLNNDWILNKDYGNFNHGYTVTSHASQGKTVNTVLIAQSSKSFNASSKEQFYVSVSRAKQNVKIYTDDKKALKQAIMRSDERTTATELLSKNKTKDYLGFIQRSKILMKGYVTRMADNFKNRIELYGKQSQKLGRQINPVRTR